jgi:hypothetical protein
MRMRYADLPRLLCLFSASGLERLPPGRCNGRAATTDLAPHYAGTGAVVAGIERVADIIDNGSNALGTLLEQCSDMLLERFHQAGLIIAKGQGNYEGLSRESAPIFFLLQVKCGVIARDLGVAAGDIILKQQALSDANG